VVKPARAKTWVTGFEQQMAVFQPARQQAFVALLDVIDAHRSDLGRPRLLDLGGGAGSWSLQALRRWPDASITLADIDPVLLALARAGLEDWVQIAKADFRTPAWTQALPHHDYDAVVAVMALHYLPEQRLSTLYREIAGVLAPRGLFLNADRMPEDGLPSLTASLDQAAARRGTTGAVDADRVPAWDRWWQELEADPELNPLFATRSALFGDQPSAEWTPEVSWHVEALHKAGYAEVGQAWRHGAHAAVAALGGT
jgi:SAM-dependent methyltransferase